MGSIGFVSVRVLFDRCEHSERVFKRLLGYEQYADISPTDRQHQMRNHRARNSNLNGVRSWACTAGASLALEDPARSSLSLRRACAATTPFPSPGWDLPGNPNSRPPPRRLRARRPVLPHCCASRSLQLPAQQTSAYPSAAARPANPSPISVRRGLATPSTLRLSPLQYPARCAHDPWAAAPCGTTAAQRRFLARGGPAGPVPGPSPVVADRDGEGRCPMLELNARHLCESARPRRSVRARAGSNPGCHLRTGKGSARPALARFGSRRRSARARAHTEPETPAPGDQCGTPPTSSPRASRLVGGFSGPLLPASP